MNKHPKYPQIPKIPPTDDVQRDGAVPPVTRERLSATVSDLLEKHWIKEEPGERCFDHNEARMDRLVSFLEGHANQETAEDVKDHLLECSRCRFLYARIRDTVKPAPAAVPDGPRGSGEPIPDLLCDNLRSAGAVVFPDSKVARGAWEFGQLGSLDDKTFEDVVEIVAGRAWCKLRGLMPRNEVVLVCFSKPVHICGKRLATKMIESGVKNVHVVMADDYFNPKLWCDPEELKGQHVVVFVDVVHTGGLLNRLYAACREACPRKLTGVAVIDQSTECVSKEEFYPLWTEPPEVRVPFDTDRHRRARFFDPASALSRPREDLPKEIADPNAARATVESHLTAIEPLRPYIDATSALRRDAKFGGVYYPWAVDLLRLLEHDEARAELVVRAADRLNDLRARGPWCLIYPAERSKRAGTWAELIGTAFRWPIVKVGLKARTHYRQLTPTQRQELEQCPRALIIDAAVRTGKTLQSLVHLLRPECNPLPCEISAFYAFDGLCREPRESLEKTLNLEIRSLFRLPLGAPTQPVGRHCRQRMTDTLQELADLEADGPSAWVNIVRDYCKKQLRKKRGRGKARPHESIDRSLRCAIDEGERGTQARLEQSCQAPKATLVKHLDVTYALGEPRTRNVLHGFLCNSMPPDFIEWCALALATQKDYDWLDRDWLMIHKRLFTNTASPRWQFLACVSYWIRQHGDDAQVRRVREAIDDFRRSQTSDTLSLFPEVFEEPESLDSRCKTLIAVLSRS